MKYDQGDPQELKDKFWKALDASPYVMLQLDKDAESAAPMTAQLDKDAAHAIWFFTSRNNHFAAMGPATATFASKGHDLFARFTGTLVEETSRERLDKEWNNFVEAWFPGGKDDPDLLLMRMDLGKASIWAGEVGALNTVKMALGMDVTDTIKGGFAQTTL
ncbi:pyridoxamine 5'-phosphate oxidase family protein [Novosphingobium sp. KCTC 2891]|uniref:pyridoxamine 5'-phosphate oxidase family protein n=1 Tax=Novosphingobium sp. KCTC 2891 TaxID=2989730 RepID=UPI002223A21A|nr:pyridoxamine 5'-phosphate oxidase family protein [Novosphingobium sp. KCTC 2891]MCW1381674.1 pyridoxamine 5'-phosphate oxidase family protein [Novosphingobium sp. KCTC 2891]